MSELCGQIKITHPFHPLYRRTFQFVRSHKCWGYECVDYFDTKTETIAYIPKAWTDLATADNFLLISNGRARFHFNDLLRLVDLASDLKAKLKENDM